MNPRLLKKHTARRLDASRVDPAVGGRNWRSNLLVDLKTMAILLVEQFYDFAEELANQYIVMERGEVKKRGRGADMEADGVRGLMSI